MIPFGKSAIVFVVLSTVVGFSFVFAQAPAPGGPGQPQGAPPQDSGANNPPPAPPQNANPGLPDLPGIPGDPSGLPPLDFPQNGGASGGVVDTGGTVKRDPFKLPQYLIKRIREEEERNRPKVVTTTTVEEKKDVIDDSVEPIRRWPLNFYTVVGILWDVKNPKALIQDPQKKIHFVKLSDEISRDKAIIKSIREGTVVVQVGKVEQVIRLNNKK